MDEAVKYKSLMSRAIVEGYMKDSGDGLQLDAKYKVEVREVEIM